MNEQKAPFPWFGGKSQAAPAVWEAMGDVEHYVEPFAGSLAVLLRRPHLANRPYHSETVNDLDCYLANAWRSIRLSPDATAEAASWPVSEIDMHARHIRLLSWKEEGRARCGGDPEYHDPVLAGWWLWGVSCWIGSGWCGGDGPWTSKDGKLIKMQPTRKGREPGVKMQRPQLTDNGQGVNHADLREPGVWMQRPHTGDNGQGVNHADLREPGVWMKLPHLSNNGQGVNSQTLREPGVKMQLPHLSNNGQGVNHPDLREPDIESDAVPHPDCMPKLRMWFALLSARLRHVRVLCGDWKRCLTGGALNTLSVARMGGDGHCGVFLDPPYADTADRDKDLYGEDSLDVAHEVRRWAIANGQTKWLRIVVAGFEGEHGDEFEQAGWRSVEWFKGGFLTGGMGHVGKNGKTHQQHRERLWLSPNCLQRQPEKTLFDALK